jgi:hypothetical protein
MSEIPSPFISAMRTSESLKRTGLALWGTQCAMGFVETSELVASVQTALPKCPSPSG